ncbi:MAG: hypothetical protein IMZ62_11990 [Chloroflexi bacterium]|nr:hypothetical protein [Chloroflexota bacterium]
MPLGQIVRAWGAVDYEPDLRFFNHLWHVAKERYTRKEADPESGFEHWRTDSRSVLLTDTLRHDSMVISFKRMHFEAADSADPEGAVHRLATHIRQALHGLNQPSLKRMGLKLAIYADLGLPFETIRDHMRPLCLPENTELSRLTSNEVTDVALCYYYKRNGNTGMLRAGPMLKKQGIHWLHNTGDLKNLFPPAEERGDFVAFCDSVPGAFLYFELDMYRDTPSPNAEWTKFASEAYTHIESVFTGLKSLARGTAQ